MKIRLFLLASFSILLLAGCQVSVRETVPSAQPHAKIKIKTFDRVPPHGGWGSCAKCHTVAEARHEKHEKKEARKKDHDREEDDD